MMERLIKMGEGGGTGVSKYLIDKSLPLFIPVKDVSNLELFSSLKNKLDSYFPNSTRPIGAFDVYDFRFIEGNSIDRIVTNTSLFEQDNYGYLQWFMEK